MCVLAMAWKTHPEWRLVVAGNRDEAHARPTDPLGLWLDDPEVIGGRDRLSGGGWLGVAPHRGRFAVITNLAGQGSPDPSAPSRGALVHDALTQVTGSEPLEPFNPFSLITVAQDEAWFTTNRPSVSRRRLIPGLYALSNGPLDAPWDKTVRLKSALNLWLIDEARDPADLLAALDDRETHGGQTWDEAHASPLFLENPRYGTRCSTVVTVDAAGRGRIRERRFDAAGQVSGETEIAFDWRP
jgi:uncharacterized protein with NRDE domain